MSRSTTGDRPNACAVRGEVLPPCPSPLTQSPHYLPPSSLWCPHGQHRCNGPAGLARQASRLCVPVLRDLRRTGLGVGLRAPGRGAQEESQGGLVGGGG